MRVYASLSLPHAWRSLRWNAMHIVKVDGFISLNSHFPKGWSSAWSCKRNQEEKDEETFLQNQSYSPFQRSEQFTMRNKIHYEHSGSQFIGHQTETCRLYTQHTHIHTHDNSKEIWQWARSEVLTEVLLWTQVFWDVMLRRWVVSGSQCFEEQWCLHLGRSRISRIIMATSTGILSSGNLWVILGK